MSKHVWAFISGGMYDAFYQCEICGMEYVDSVDDFSPGLPMEGCIEDEPDGQPDDYTEQQDFAQDGEFENMEASDIL